MPLTKVLVSDKLSQAGLDVLGRASGIEVHYRPGLSGEELASIIGGYDALVVRSASKVTEHVISQALRLRVIGRAGIGVDNVDLRAASKRGIVVMNTPTGNAVTTAEHALALLMSAARRIPAATASTRAGKWEKSKLQGREVANKTLGIIGLGNIGRIVADRAQGLKMRVIARDPVVPTDTALRLGVELVSLDELYARADFISVHAPSSSETRGMLDDAAFEKMRPGVIIVNAARGGIVDEAALARAIESGKVLAAALDVFEKEPVDPDNPLLRYDQVVLTPHIGASTFEAQERVAVEIAHQVVDFLVEGTIHNGINAADVGPEVARKIRPYLDVARKLGTLLGHLGPMDAQVFRVTCTGEAGELGVTPIAHSALAGYLERHVAEPINYVSAPVEAQERGISIVEVREEATRGFATTVRVAIHGGRESHVAVGSLGVDEQPLLVGLEGYELDAALGGTTLVIRNADRPGVIGAVGTILGRRNINVSRMQVGLDPTKGEAMAVWNLDSPVPADALDEVRSIENVKSVLCVEL